MPSFDSIASMESYIKSKMQIALLQTQEVINEVIDRFVKEYYAEFSPEMYNRTYQLYRSLVKTGIEPYGNGYSVAVYFDADKLDYAMKTITTRSGKKYTIANKGWSAEATLEASAKGYHGSPKIKGTAIYNEPRKLLIGQKEAMRILKRMLISAGLPVK